MDELRPIARRVLALFVASTIFVATGLFAAPPRPQSQNAETVKARVRDLHESGSDVQVRRADGDTVQGRILRAEAESFTIREKQTSQELTIPYARVTEVKKKGSPRKAILIPAIVGGAVLLLLCVGPYPIGFLCRTDPS